MTAQTITGAVAAPRPADRRLAGFGALLRKDTTEWMRGRRAWVVAVASTLFMALTAANGWITATIAKSLPPDAMVGDYSLDPTQNLMAAVSAQVFVFAAILAVASLIVAERQSGTLAWVASKPVSRGAIWASKLVSASAILAMTAVVVPFVITAGVVVALYGAPSFGMAAGVVAGMVAVVVFFAAVGLAAATVVTSQAGVIGIGFAVFAAMPILSGVLPFDVAPLLPVSILTWFAGIASGAPVGWVTPVAYLVATTAVIAFGHNRLARMEL